MHLVLDLALSTYGDKAGQMHEWQRLRAAALAHIVDSSTAITAGAIRGSKLLLSHTLLTAAKPKGMNSTTAARVASSPRSASSRNLRATECSDASGHGWNL